MNPCFLILLAGLVCSALRALAAEHFSTSVPGWVSSLCFSPNGQQLAVGSADSSAHLLDIETGNEIGLLRGHKDYVTAVAFSPDGQTIATSSYDGTARLWNPKSGRVLQSLRGHRGAVMSVAFSPDGNLLVTGSIDSTLKLWNIRTGKLRTTLRSHKSWVNSITFSADGQWLISGSSDGTVKIWQGRTGKLEATLDATEAEVRSVALAPNGKMLAAGLRYGMLKVWEVATRRELFNIKAHESDVWSVAFTPDNLQLISGNGDWNKPGQVKIWDAAIWHLRTTLATSGEVLAVACSPDGKTIAAGCGDGGVKAWTFGEKLFAQGLPVEERASDAVPGRAKADALPQPLNTWAKRTPLSTASVSPRLGYEGACVWDSKHRVVIRYGGHNQGGGGEQGSEVWTFDPFSTKWTLREPNTSPPGVCCNAQNAFDPVSERYLRFPSFSGSHGWQWWREIYLNDTSVWTYDLASNLWRNMRPLPAPHVAPLRCAAWDSDEQVVVVFGGEGGPQETLSYDPHRNEWRWMKPKLQPEPRSGGQMAYDSAHKVHVLFGSQFNNDPHTWIYSLAKNEWRDALPPSSPPTDKNDAVLTYDPIRQVVVALVKITTGQEEEAKHHLETWTYHVASNLWSKLDPAQEPDPSGNRARQLMFAPELGMTLLENCPSKPREQQIWTLRLTETNAALPQKPALRPRAEPRMIDDATVSVLAPTRVELSWKSHPGVQGYHVERAPVEVLSEDQLPRLKKQTMPLAEPSVGALRRIGAFTRLTPAPIPFTTFTDTNIDLQKPGTVGGEPIYERKFSREQFDESGKPYRFAVFAYRLRAVNAAGRESGPSPAFFTIPSAPQWLFSQEEGTTCHLKWAANAEKELQGYRVYRMNGRYDKDLLPRLTAEPLNETRYSDPTAGKSSRRYYVVAVDALGQEGFPSAPVWFEREWKQYYAPFVGSWHQ